jgi:hypothetical protein
VTNADRQPPTIPGYTLTTRLGAGGYGEVWLAHAPGGLTKAVKIIYGAFDDRRAELELRSLHRIKMVRHPFLLSLERIEVVDNRLAIVTELADASLKDRYEECRRSGLPGVPRAELLGLLRDAADALDFLTERHSLQHLDVKPENLLLVGGHVKVADFGLVKEVGRTQASLVGGLTPLYSSPEVFQGTPGARSDQYSLAVVFQEMLTGRPPFSGQTAAELTMQHLQGDPDVAALPMSDRFVIARALSKNPEQRFSSCTEMLDALLAATEVDEQPPTIGEAATAETSFDESTAFPDCPTEPLVVVEQTLAAPWSRAEANSPPRLQVVAPVGAPTDFAPCGAAVIGIGGLAGKVLRRLRGRLARELGDAGREAVSLLLLDSDPLGISAALDGSDRAALRPEETLAVPLRRSQDYRDDASNLLRWLNRRWLYNVPKSLRTEGLRPLGRLAFVDHASQIADRIRQTLARALPTATGASERLRVYVVAGVSGGTGSGMSLDVGYALREIIRQSGLTDVEVVGLFLHSTGGDARQNDLARVNSFAWLREYNHYHRPQGAYPGDEGCRIPSYASEVKAFDAAYFVDLGVAVDDQALDDAAREAAEYLYLDAATPAHSFFAACRAEQSAAGYAPLCSLTLQASSAASDQAIRTAANAISRAVLGAYLDAGSTPSTAAPPEGVELATLVARTRAIIEGQCPATAAPIEGADFVLDAFVRGVDQCFAPPDDRPGAFVAGQPVENVVAAVAAEMSSTLTACILQRIDERGERLTGALALVEGYRQILQRTEAEASQLADGIAKQAASTVVCLERWQRERKTSTTTAARERELGDAYQRLRVDQHAMLAAAAIARRLTSDLRTVGDQLRDCRRQVEALLAQFPPPAAPFDDDRFLQAVAEQLSRLAEDVDACLEEEAVGPLGGLLAVAMGSPRTKQQFAAELLRLSTRRAEQLATSPALLATVAPPAVAANPYQSIDGVDLPKISCLGGSFALLETAPATVARPIAWDQSTPGVARLVGVGSRAVRCCEAWNLSLPRVALSLIDNRPDRIEFAERVVSRCDVRWTPLPGLAESPSNGNDFAHSDDSFSAAMAPAP